MAEVQKTNSNSGEMAAQFIEFVMMQAQNASFFLGLMPNPSTGKPEVNLDLARRFIDQLAMIQEKTRNNLSNEEANILRKVLADLQMAFVEISSAAPGGSAGRSTGTATPSNLEPTTESPIASASGASESGESKPAPPSSVVDEERESKKRFTKSYGS
ncbi:MAG: DUF1844 domain-containing protein [Verrucomicrobia bacterium]|nr:DUF1844 domain-containing protein [Verrucomicrobiota bacterium]MBV9658274.1 DUF1844 domain-containing protein [Verrucomicrobiota bacterium]